MGVNCVDRVKEICKEKHIPISKLERDLGFANGYIRRLKEGNIPYYRMRKIAAYLDVTIEFLVGEKSGENDKIECDIRRISKGIRKMSDHDRERFMKIIELSFEDYFSDGYMDEDMEE